MQPEETRHFLSSLSFFSVRGHWIAITLCLRRAPPPHAAVDCLDGLLTASQGHVTCPRPFCISRKTNTRDKQQMSHISKNRRKTWTFKNRMERTRYGWKISKQETLLLADQHEIWSSAAGPHKLTISEIFATKRRLVTREAMRNLLTNSPSPTKKNLLLMRTWLNQYFRFPISVDKPLLSQMSFSN